MVNNWRGKGLTFDFKVYKARTRWNQTSFVDQPDVERLDSLDELRNLRYFAAVSQNLGIGRD